jgi:hypothetical protein
LPTIIDFPLRSIKRVASAHVVAKGKENPVMQRLMATISIGAILAGPALGAEPYVGTWSRDRGSCTAAANAQRQTVYTLYRKALSIPDLGCDQAKFRKTATGWLVRASQCYGSDPSAEEPFSRVIHIVTDGTVLRLTWPGFDSGPLLRC